MTDWLEIPIKDLPRAIPKQKRETLKLTRRQVQVLQLIALGKGNKEIGRVLGCHERSVEAHRFVMKLRAGCPTIIQLVIAADRLFREM